MRWVFFVLGFVFSILGVLGAGYVLFTGGQANPGGPLIAVIFSTVCFLLCRKHF